MFTRLIPVKLILLAAFFVFTTACEKPAGPGGRATIKGRVYAYDFDNTQRYKLSEGYSQDDRVYIIYGDNTVIDDDVRTSYDGSFEFRFLTKGKYKIFVNSLDTSIRGSLTKGLDTYKPVIKEVTITGNNQEVTLEDFKINK